MILRDFTSNDWFTISLLLIGISFVMLRQINVIKYVQFSKLFYSNEYFKYKDKESRFYTAFEIVAIIIAHLIIAQFVYFVIKDFEYISILNIYPFFEVFIIFLLVAFLSFLKYQLEKLVNISINNSKTLKYYLFYKQLIWSYSIFLGLPILIFVVYRPSQYLNLLHLSFVIMGVFYVLKMLYLIYYNRSLLIKSWYYFILYLCAFEIAPYYFLYKIFAIE